MNYRRPWIPICLGAAVLLSACVSQARSSKSAKKEAAPKAEAISEQASEDRIRAQSQFASGILKELNDEPEEALKSFTDSALADPEHAALVIEVARRWLREKKPEQALEVLENAAKSADAPGIIHTLLGLAQSETGHPKSAVASYQKAIKKSPRDIFPYRSLSQLYLDLKQPRLALKTLEQAEKSASNDPAFLLSLAEGLAAYIKNQPADAAKVKPMAVTVVNRARAGISGQPGDLQRVAEMYEAVGEIDQAEAIYLDLIKRFPVAGTLRGKLTGLYLRSGNKARAREQLNAIVRDNPANPNVHYLLGTLAAEEKKYYQAIESYERALQLRPDWEELYYDLVGVLFSAQQPQRALEILANAREKFSKKFVNEFYSGLAEARLKRYDEALKHFTEAEVLAKVNEPERLGYLFYFQVGSVLERKGDLPGAEKYLKKSIELSPDFVEAMNYLGYMWADKGMKLPEARKMIEKALEKEPKNAAFLDSMAWVLYKMNLAREALDYQLKAVANSEEEDATLYDHLGDIYSALDNQPKAREYWEKSLKIEPNEAVKKKISPAS